MYALLPLYNVHLPFIPTVTSHFDTSNRGANFGFASLRGRCGALLWILKCGMQLHYTRQLLTLPSYNPPGPRVNPARGKYGSHPVIPLQWQV